MGFGAAAPWDLKHVIWSSGTVGFGAWRYILIGAGGSVGFGSVALREIWEQRGKWGCSVYNARHKEWVRLASVLWVDLKTETKDIKENENTLVFVQHIDPKYCTFCSPGRLTGCTAL